MGIPPGVPLRVRRIPGRRHDRRNPRSRHHPTQSRRLSHRQITGHPPCSFLGSDLKVEAAGRIRYPDGFVVCTPGPNTSTVVADPIVVFEILSPSTSSTDRIEKHEEYRATPSIRRYVILEQDRIAATVFARAGGDWTGHVFLDGAILAMPEIGIDVPLAEFYDGLAFDQPDEAKDGAPRAG